MEDGEGTLHYVFQTENDGKDPSDSWRTYDVTAEIMGVQDSRAWQEVAGESSKELGANLTKTFPDGEIVAIGIGKGGPQSGGTTIDVYYDDLTVAGESYDLETPEYPYDPWLKEAQTDNGGVFWNHVGGENEFALEPGDRFSELPSPGQPIYVNLENEEAEIQVKDGSPGASVALNIGRYQANEDFHEIIARGSLPDWVRIPTGIGTPHPDHGKNYELVSVTETEEGFSVTWKPVSVVEEGESLQQAIDDARAGETIYLKNGSYDEDITVDKNVTITADGGATPTLEGIVELNAAGATFKDIKMRDYSVDSGGDPVIAVKAEDVTVHGIDMYKESFEKGTQPYGITVTADADGAEITDNIVDRGWEGGHPSIMVEQGANDVEVVGNEIAKSGTGAIGASVASGESLTIKDNIVHNGYEGGIWLYKVSDADVVVEGNTVHDYGIGKEAAALKIVKDPNTLNGEDLTAGRMAYELIAANDLTENEVKVRGTVYTDDITIEDEEAYYAKVQDAVDAAGAGQTIDLAPGTYEGRVTITDDITLVGAGQEQTTITAGTEDVSTNFEPTLSIYADATVRDLAVERTVDTFTSEGHTKAVGISRKRVDDTCEPTDARLQDVDVELADTTGKDSKGNAVWINSFNAAGGDRCSVKATLENVTAKNDGIGTDSEGFGGAAVAVLGVAKSVNLTIEESELEGSYRGLYTLNEGTSVNVDVSDTAFRDNTVHIADVAESLDMGAVKASNTFETGVFRRTAGSLTHTVRSTIGTAQETVTTGDTLHLTAGTFDETVDITTDGLTIEGAGEDATTIDIPEDHSDWGIDVSADNVALRSMTVDGPSDPSGDSEGAYGIHVDGPGVYENGTRVRFEATDITVTDSARNEFDVNGVQDAVLRDITVTGQDTAGVGLAISDAINVTVEDITSTGNTWGGIAIFTNGKYSIAPTIANITVTGHDASDPVPLYVEPNVEKEASSITGLYLEDYRYRVTNPAYRHGEFRFYYQTATAATETKIANETATVTDTESDASIIDANETDDVVEVNETEKAVLPSNTTTELATEDIKVAVTPEDEAVASVTDHDEANQTWPDTEQEFVGATSVTVTDDNDTDVDSSGQVNISYSQSYIQDQDIDEGSMEVYYLNETTDSWETNGVTVTEHDLDANYIVADVAHFSTYAAYGDEETSDQEDDASTGGGGSIAVDEPDASFSVTSQTVVAGEETSFDGSESIDRGGSIESYEWSFGATGVTAATDFDTVGEQTVTLTVTDAEGNTDTASTTITVEQNQDPTVTVEGQTSVDAGQDASYTATITDPDTDDHVVAWDNGATGTSATYSFEEPGSQEITVTVTDSDGDTVTETVTVDVASTSGTSTETGPAESDETDDTQGDGATDTPTGLIAGSESSVGLTVVVLLAILAYVKRDVLIDAVDRVRR